MNLTEIDKRQLTFSAQGKGELQRQSNFDKPERRVQKLIDLGLLVSSTQATDTGKKLARELLEKSGHGVLADNIK